EVRGAPPDLDEFGLDDGRHRVAALAQARAVHPVAVVGEHDGPHDAAGVLGAHVEFLAQRRQRHFEVLDQRVGLVLVVERVLVRVLHGVLGAVVDLPERRGEAGPLQLGQGVGHQHRLHELLGHADVEERARLLALAHLDDAALLVEVDVGEAAHGDGQRRVLALFGGHEHHVRHADQLLLDGSRALYLCLGHESLYRFLRLAVFAGRFAALVGRAAFGAWAALVLPLRRAAAGLSLPSAGASAGATAPGAAPANTGASPSGPSGVTMIG